MLYSHQKNSELNGKQGILLPETASTFVDRISMFLHYDRIYTTHEKRPPLKALILLTNLEVEDLPRVLSEREKVARSYSVSARQLGPSLYKVFLQRMIGLRQIRTEVIIDSGCEGVWIVLTDAGSYFTAHVLETFFDKLYPVVTKLFLNYSQMRSLLEIIRRSCNGRTALTFFTIKRTRASKSTEDETFSHAEETEILWGEHVDEDIKRRISEGFIVRVDRLDFELRDAHSIILKAQISRRGLSKLKFGSFSHFYQNVVFNTIEFGRQQKNFYDKRERYFEEGTIHLRPLQINYSERFREEQLGRFARRITDSYSTSIIHGGNPYFVADLCDYQDGSSFGVAILGNSITVTPVTRATPSAVWKLLSEIQEILGDGEIVDVSMR
jgi:hypothetical protein